MKKVLILVLVFSLLSLCFVGCSSSKKTLSLEIDEKYILEISYSDEYTLTDERANHVNQKPVFHDIKIIKGEYEAYVQLMTKDSFEATKKSRIEHAQNSQDNRIKTTTIKEETYYLFDKESHFDKNGDLTKEIFGYLYLVDESKNCAIEVFSNDMPQEEVEKIYKNIKFVTKDK